MNKAAFRGSVNSRDIVAAQAMIIYPDHLTSNNKKNLVWQKS